MSDDTLFDFDEHPRTDVRGPADLGATGGLQVVVDPTFATAERIQLDGTSWVDHVHGWLDGDEILMDLLMTTADWEQRSRWMYTRTIAEPRLTAEYPDLTQAPHPVLRYIATALSAHYRRQFARLWMNWYRDHDDATGWHADRPADKQAEAVIPVLSLGAARRFLIRPESGGTSRTLLTRGGDLIVMGGRTQRDYRHSVPRQKQTAGPRLSLNFSIDLPGRA